MPELAWFHSKDLTTERPSIKVDDIYGYGLPLVGTRYTGDIIQHTHTGGRVAESEGGGMAGYRRVATSFGAHIRAHS
jgi:hypothetical protein